MAVGGPVDIKVQKKLRGLDGLLNSTGLPRPPVFKPPPSTMTQPTSIRGKQPLCREFSLAAIYIAGTVGGTW